MEKNELLIFGTGDFADILAGKLENDGKRITGYTINREWKKNETYRGKPLWAFEDIEDNIRPTECDIYIGVIGKGMFQFREEIYRKLSKKHYNLPNYISSSAKVFSENIGNGNIIMENVVIEKHCILGNGNIIWPNVVMPHHNKVGNFNNLSPSVSFSGYSEVGNRCFIGNNASLNNHVKVYDMALVGAGVFVSKCLQKESVLVSERSYVLEGRKSYEFK